VKDTATCLVDEEGGPMGQTNATLSCKSQPVAVFTKSSPGSCVTNASKPRIYDEKWADKQCEAFAGWLNYTFQPSEDKDHEANVLDTKEEGSDAKKADRAALRTLILHRRMAQVRAKAIDVFNSESMKMAQRSIHAEVARRRLKLREDRDMYADLTLREQITSLMLSYSTPWLRLGLETIFGEVISPDSPNHFSPQKAGFGNQGIARKAEKVCH
jgi:abnormal spindle-like microcephaly-associated protein